MHLHTLYCKITTRMALQNKNKKEIQKIKQNAYVVFVAALRPVAKEKKILYMYSSLTFLYAQAWNILEVHRRF